MVERVEADWPAPATVQAFTTTRSGGVSTGGFHSLNLGDACGDDPASVRENRSRLATLLPSPPGWLQQVHGRDVARREALVESPTADAVTCRRPGLVCTLLTADCLPVLLCAMDGSEVAAAHAGWRGLAAGVLEATLEAMHTPPEAMMAWLGPGIGQAAFEIGPEVREALLQRYPKASSAFHRPVKRWHADLFAIARHALARAGVASVTGGQYCTYTESERFFSHRRDGRSGRMASVIWFE